MKRQPINKVTKASAAVLIALRLPFHPTMSLEKGPLGPIYKAQGQSIQYKYTLISAMQGAIASSGIYLSRFKRSRSQPEDHSGPERARERFLESISLLSSKFGPADAECGAAG